jgi:hypothetical protein
MTTTTQGSQQGGRTSSKTDASQHAEGRVAKAIEKQTAKIPSDSFLWLAGGAIVGSLGLRLMRRKNMSLFVGQWVPTILMLGLYNKIVKVAGSDQTDEEFRVMH